MNDTHTDARPPEQPTPNDLLRQTRALTQTLEQTLNLFKTGLMDQAAPAEPQAEPSVEQKFLTNVLEKFSRDLAIPEDFNPKPKYSGAAPPISVEVPHYDVSALERGEDPGIAVRVDIPNRDRVPSITGRPQKLTKKITVTARGGMRALDSSDYSGSLSASQRGMSHDALTVKTASKPTRIRINMTNFIQDRSWQVDVSVSPVTKEFTLHQLRLNDRGQTVIYGPETFPNRKSDDADLISRQTPVAQQTGASLMGIIKQLAITRDTLE